MDVTNPAHVLVVANKTAATPALLEAIRQRVQGGGSVYFHLLVPKVPNGYAVVAGAVPLIEEAAHRPVTGAMSAREDPMDAIEEALHDGDFDEIILSTLAPSASRWLRLDLPSRVAHLGLPLTTVVAREREPEPGSGRLGHRLPRFGRIAPGEREVGHQGEDAAEEDVAGAGRPQA
jgi:hypothetical protein